MPHDPRLIRAKAAIRRARAYNLSQRINRVAFWSAVTFFVCVPLFILGVYITVRKSEFYGSLILYPAMVLGFLSGLAYPNLLVLRNTLATGRVPQQFSLRTLLMAITLGCIGLGMLVWKYPVRVMLVPVGDGELKTKLTFVSPLTEEQVLSIAKEAVRQHGNWQDEAEFDTPRRQSDGTWMLCVWDTPKKPGGFWTISIDAKGVVTDYSPGE